MAATCCSSPAIVKKHFRNLKDPRVVGRTKHLLLDIIVITLSAVIGRCDDWQEITIFAQEREDWFRKFLKLPNGIPSVDTFERVFQKLDPLAFQRCCVDWLKYAADLVGMPADTLDHISIDGKTVRGSGNRTFRPLHLVSAWASKAKLFLGQVATDEKSNEITAIPKLLELLDLKGALVTIDAMGCQKEIAKQIVAKGGDYVLSVKENQERLHQDIREAVDLALQGKLPEGQMRQIHTKDDGHGRVEERSYIVITKLDTIRDRKLWPGLKTIGACIRHRTVNEEQTSELHYFIGSRNTSVRKYAEVLRGHWGIENNLHWQLDVSFGEDHNAVSERNAAENLATIRKTALGLVKQNPRKESIAKKRLRAAVNPDFLQEILSGANNLVNV